MPPFFFSSAVAVGVIVVGSVVTKIVVVYVHIRNDQHGPAKSCSGNPRELLVKFVAIVQGVMASQSQPS